MKTVIVKENGMITGNVRELISLLSDGKYTVTIEKHRDVRSLNQNKYYHGVVVKILSDHTGYEPDFMHEILKNKFLDKKVVKNPLDKRRKIVKQESTTELDTKEFTEYIEKIRVFFKDINIPSPDSKEALAAYEYYLSRF